MRTRADAYATANSPDLNVNGWTGLTVSVWISPVYWAGYNYGGANGFTTYGRIITRGPDTVGGAFAISAPAANSWDASFLLNFSPTNGVVAAFQSFHPSRPPYPVIGRTFLC